MGTQKELVFYGRTYYCPDQERALRFLNRHQITYKRIDIDQDVTASTLLQQWVGYQSVPTLVIARQGEVTPIEEPVPVPQGRSIRSLDRGTLITEPSEEALRCFLQRHGLL